MKEFNQIAAIASPRQNVWSCCCAGPQNGDPVCPCLMAGHREKEKAKSALDFINSDPTMRKAFENYRRLREDQG